MSDSLDTHFDVDDEAIPAALRMEVLRLAADPVDRAELMALRDELDELTPSWPDE